ncbi:MAG TPA: helix-turn-helix transcriptional regulator [Bryobacteraceae bacterium]|jgi:DNA-binding PadR family transcriptional regulator
MRHVEQEPLTEPVLLILMSLAGQPRHGYVLMKDIEELSEGRVRLSTGTLYGALHRLLRGGLIERFEQQDTSREKQAYRLTRAGTKQLRAELDRMKQLTRAAATRLKWKEA